MQTIRPSRRKRIEIARDVVAADDVEHDVDAAPAGEALDFGDEIGRAIVDRVGGTKRNARGALFVGDPAVAIAVAPSAVANMMAVVPMPLVPPCTRTVSPARKPTAREEVVVDRERVLRQASRPRSWLQPRGTGKHLAVGSDDVLGVAAAVDERADLVAESSSA